MSKLSRTKGRDWQSKLAKRWRDSGLFPGAVSSHGGQKLGPGKKPADIEATPYAVEAKHRRAANPIQALEQAELEAKERGDARPPVAIVRPHRSSVDDAVVVMRLTTFEALVAAIGGWAFVPGTMTAPPAMPAPEEAAE
jgi:hypothetical protein